MSKSRILVTAITCLALAAGSGPALADPGGGNGKDQGNWKGNSQGGKANVGQGKQGHQGKSQGSQGHQGNQGNQGHQGNQGNMSGDSDWRHGPSIDRGIILGVLGGYRDYWNPGPALPPGIQKNLVRGKPLPPGIAKKLDSRLLGRLPHYDGYEWRQAGTDLILVAIATGIIYEVLNGALD